MLPHASGYAIARAPRITGPFQGTMDSTVPTGWRRVMDNAPGLSVGMVSPLICVVIAAASRSRFADAPTLNCAHSCEAPISSAIAVQKSAILASSASAAANRIRRRSVGPVPDQVWNARSDDWAARNASSTLQAAPTLTVCEPRGSMRSNVLPSEADCF
ncbi:hypothetical protein D3C78_1335530 [compost metagenome]